MKGVLWGEIGTMNRISFMFGTYQSTYFNLFLKMLLGAKKQFYFIFFSVLRTRLRVRTAHCLPC